MTHALDLAKTFVSLGTDGRTLPMDVTERFWPDLEAGRIGAGPGRLLSLFEFDTSWDVWERHPNGDEIVLLLDGEVEIQIARQLAARDRWREVGTPAGAVRASLPPFNLSEFEPRMDDVPALGAHSRAVLAELGYAAAEIDALAADGAVRTS